MREYDVVVIGGGLLGCFTARKLREYELSVCVIEAADDVCTGMSRANSAIVYPGYDTKPWTLKHRLCVDCNAAFGELCRELGVDFTRCGSILISLDENGDETLYKKYDKGIKAGLELQLLSTAETLRMEPGITERARLALYSPDAGTVLPWELCFAAAENAAANGAVFRLGERVTGISRTDGGYEIRTVSSSGKNGETETYRCRAAVNAAGLAATRIYEMISPRKYITVPTRNDHIILDGRRTAVPGHVIFTEGAAGKGATLVPTVEGNLMIASTHYSLPEDDGSRQIVRSTSREVLESTFSEAKEAFSGIERSAVIRSFGALRPDIYRIAADGSIDREHSIHSFTIEEHEDAPGFYSLLGIKTPGMTAADGIGRYVAEMVAERLSAAESGSFDPVRPPRVRVNRLSRAEREALVRRDPAYGRVVCSCRDVTEGEVLDAIRTCPGAKDAAGVSRRTGAGMGDCQGSFCGERIAQIIERELGGTAQEKAAGKCADSDLYADVTVIGGGGAGMAAAVGALRGGADSVVMIDRGEKPGGIMNQCLHPGFGKTYYREAMSGVEYAVRYSRLLEDGRIVFLAETEALSVDPECNVVISSADGVRTVHSGCIVMATGCREKNIRSLFISGTHPAGVMTAGTAQHMMNVRGLIPGRDYVIVGSGNVGLIMAGEIGRRGLTVKAIVEKEAGIGGSDANRRDYVEPYGIPVMTQSEVTRLHGDGHITGVTVKNNVTGESTFIECDTLITALGMMPETRLTEDIISKEAAERVFFAGDCDHIHPVVDLITKEAEKIGCEAAEKAGKIKNS